MITVSKNNLPDSIIERTAGFFARGGALDKACAKTEFPFEIRPQQQKMAEAVAEALAESEHLAVEAGTGVGKTFAYLVPLIIFALEHERRVAVSTHTINLQEQLVFKDLPFLLENMGVDFTVALCKGRHNYLCLRRLESAHQMSGDLFNKNREKELSRIRHWAEAGGLARRSHESCEGEGGSLSDFTDTAQPSAEVWHQVCSEHDNCLGRKCRHYARCFLMKARNTAFDADLLILNHHLFFSDLALRQDGAGILPDFETIVIDEAHSLEDIASEHLGLRLSQGGIYHWLRRLHIPASGKGLLTALKEHELADETDRLWENVEHFFVEIGNHFVIPDLIGNPGNLKLDSHFRGNDKTNRNGAFHAKMPGKYVFKKEPDFKTMLVEQIAHLVHSIEKLRDATKDEELQAELNAICRRGDEIRATLDFFLKQADPGHVYWIEQDNGGRISLVSAPIEVSPLLKDLLFGSFCPVVLTSATLSINGSLEYFRSRIGSERCRELILDSPFNYQRQMKVFVVADMPEPNDEKFPETVVKAVEHFVHKTRGRAFVLFTNAELMRYVAGQLKDSLAEQGFLTLVQGEGLPRHVMLKEFKDAHKQKENPDIQSVFAEAAMPDKSKIATSAALPPSGPLPTTGDGKIPKPKIGKAVLFGLDSFWMGVDVQGEALSNVIIVRLPFAVPDEPLIKARLDRITAEGKDAFRKYSLPQAILKFRQGVGRLIRTAHDEGIIVILDSRIVSRWYGKFFLQSIPKCPVEKTRLEEGITEQ